MFTRFCVARSFQVAGRLTSSLLIGFESDRIEPFTADWRVLVPTWQHPYRERKKWRLNWLYLIVTRSKPFTVGDVICPVQFSFIVNGLCLFLLSTVFQSGSYFVTLCPRFLLVGLKVFRHQIWTDFLVGISVSSRGVPSWLLLKQSNALYFLHVQTKCLLGNAKVSCLSIYLGHILLKAKHFFFFNFIKSLCSTNRWCL